MKTRIVLSGIGNEFRSDDALGLIIVRELEKMNLPDIKILEESGEGTALMESWKDADAVLLFDVVATGNYPPGTVFRFDTRRDMIPAEFFHYSTHHFGLAEAVELARTLNQLPPYLIVYGAVGVNFTYGTQLTSEVERAILEIIDLVLLDLDEIRYKLNIPLFAGGYLF